MIDSRSQALDFNREVQARMLESLAAKSTLHIAVVGGGATGVELAADSSSSRTLQPITALPGCVTRSR